MRLLFISGSLRRNGSTEGVLNACVEHLARFAEVEVDVVHLCDRQVDMCDSCYACEAKRVCWMSDDVAGVVRKMMMADGIIYAFPVHAFGVNSLMQTFLERAGVGYLRFSRPLENKAAGIIVTGRRYGHEMAWAQVALNVMLNRMVLLGTGFPGVIKNDGKRLGDQVEDAEGLASTKDMLDKMVSFLMERVGHRRFVALPAVQ
jgi:multimeric flavodoxin WrbA